MTDITGANMLRKTAATLANEITGAFYAFSKLLDHSSPQFTLRYVSQTGVQKQKVAAALNSVLTRQKQPPQPNTPAGDFEPPVPQNPDRISRPKLTLIKTVG